jgi:hypothetical protein
MKGSPEELRPADPIRSGPVGRACLNEGQPPEELRLGDLIWTGGDCHVP